MDIELNFDKTCRTCAIIFEGEHFSIFDNRNIDLLRMLEGFTDFHFKFSKDDNLPQTICDTCSKTLMQIHTFLKQCEKSQQILIAKLREKLDKITSNECFEIVSKYNEDYQSLNLCKDKTKFQKRVGNLRRKKKQILCNEKKSSEAEVKNDQKYYKCNSCSIKFNKFSTYRIHVKEKHPAEHITFLCDICGKEFNRRNNFLQHKNKHLGIKPYKCNICGKAFSIKLSLRSHIQRHVNPENFKCNVCGKNFTIKKCYEEHIRRHESGEKIFKCPYCPRSFKLLSTLTHHCTYHNKTLDKKYHCIDCNTNFRRSDHLKEHINGVHLKILPFKCELCTQAFVTGAKRNTHVKRMHSGKRYQCNQCDKQFSHNSSLNRHKKSHSGFKSLICEICNESFVTPIQIKKHMETHKLDEVAKNNLITQTYEKIKHIAINQEEEVKCEVKEN